MHLKTVLTETTGNVYKSNVLSRNEDSYFPF